MVEIWERAVATALDGETDVSLVRSLTLDGAVKCVHGHLPAPSIFEKFQNLQHLSMANIGASSLESFPRLQNLQKLILSDNHISGGLEHLVEVGLESLRDLDLSNNRFSEIDDLTPLAGLSLVSLDLYECPVTRVKDYRSRVFGLIRSLRYLDKMDAQGNERPDSDDEEEEEGDDDEEEEYDDDPGSGDIDCNEHQNNRYQLNNRFNGHDIDDSVVDIDEDEESDTDEEELEMSGLRPQVNGNLENRHAITNGFHEEDHGDESEGDDDDDSGDEVYDHDDGEDENAKEVQEIDSDSEDDEIEDGEDDGVEEDVDNDEKDLGEPSSNRRGLVNIEGEIDGHEQGEDEADDDDDGETGEEDDVESEDEDDDDDDDDDDNSDGYLLQPVRRGELEAAAAAGSDIDPKDDVDDDDDEEEEEEDNVDGEVQELPPSPLPASHRKRKRNEGSDEDSDDDDDGDSDEDEDIVHH